MLRIILFICLSASFANAATYSYYFSNGAAGNAEGSDTTGAGTEASPWKSLSKAGSALAAVNSNDIVYLYFDKGDTWTCDTEALTTNSLSCFTIDSTDPIVHIDAYGTGDDPVFDGLVTDFSTVDSNLWNTTYPVFYSRFFFFDTKDNCSVSNIEVEGVYGHGIYLKNSHFFTVSSSSIHDVGGFGVGAGNTGAHDCVAEYNTIYNAQSLYREGKFESWGSGIQFAPEVASSESYNNVIRHNTIYDVYGECIMSPGATIEYNVIGSCGSAAIYAVPFDQDFHDTIVRYNYVVYEDYSETIYDSHTGGTKACLNVYDEAQGGNNNAASLEIYGNICINYPYGIHISCKDVDGVGRPQCDADSVIGSVAIYDNLIIDPGEYGVWVNLLDGDYITDDFSFYNNSVQIYDNSPLQIVDDRSTGIPSGWGAGITGNHYWVEGGTATVDSDWDTLEDNTDPVLLGEPTIAWNGQTGATYFSDIEPDDSIAPASGSPIYQLNQIMYLSIAEILSFSPTPDPTAYSYYFSNGATGNAEGSDSADGSITTPWKTLSQAQSAIDALDSTDTVTLYFDKSDTWTCDTEALTTTNLSCLAVYSTNPTVHIDAYGTGADPIFDGLVTSFQDVDSHLANGTYPVSWSRFFYFNTNDNCSVQNVEIMGVYGYGIALKASHFFTLSNSTIRDIGVANIGVQTDGLHDSVAEYNTIYNGQQLYRRGKQSSWGAGVQFAIETAGGDTYDNVIRHNTIYDIYGECVMAPGATIEYNVIGSCGSAAIYAIPMNRDLHDTVVRNNYVVYEDLDESFYDYHSGGLRACFSVFDEAQGGNNNAASLEIYDNICINYPIGIAIICTDGDGTAPTQCDADAKIGSVAIYNNLIIDPYSTGLLCNLEDGSITDDFSFFNNSIQTYDNTPSYIVNDSAAGIPTGWASGITENHYWVEGGTATVDSDWDTLEDNTDPVLLGEPTTAWNGQTGATYFSDIEPDTDIAPASGSPIYQLNDIMYMSVAEILSSFSPTPDPYIPSLSLYPSGTGSFYTAVILPYDTTGITLWWRTQAIDFSSTNETLDYSIADDTAVLSGNAAINADAANLGTYGLDIPDNTSCATFTTDIDDIVGSAEGRIGFWVENNSSNDPYLMSVQYDTTNRVRMRIDSTNLHPYWQWQDGEDGGAISLVNAPDNTLSAAGTKDYLEFAWQVSSNTVKIFANGTEIKSTYKFLFAWDGEPTSLVFGDCIGASGTDIYLSGIRTTKDWTKDLYDSAAQLNYGTEAAAASTYPMTFPFTLE